MRVLSVVGRADPASTSASSTPAAVSASRTRVPAASRPTTPASTAWPPSARTLVATLPAPPTWSLRPVTSTTGTGASGEMRLTRPHTNSSSITSPTTSTRRPASALTSLRARAGDSGRIPGVRPAGCRATSRRARPCSSSTSIRTSESPKLYSKSPATKTAESAASAPAAAHSARARRAPHAGLRAAPRGTRPPPTTGTRRGRAARARRRSAARCCAGAAAAGSGASGQRKRG